jgi:hypothetical protein
MQEKVYRFRQPHDSASRKHKQIRASLNRSTRPELSEAAYVWWQTKWTGAAVVAAVAAAGLVWWIAGVVREAL